MKSPWTDVDGAFCVMYDEPVVISGKRADRRFCQTIDAVVFASSTGDALADGMMDSDREDIYIVCRQQDYAFVQSLQRGDMVSRTAFNGLSYKVQDVRRDMLMGWLIAARSV